MDLSGVQFDPFRIRYLAKFARHLNVETLILPSSPFIFAGGEGRRESAASQNRLLGQDGSRAGRNASASPQNHTAHRSAEPPAATAAAAASSSVPQESQSHTRHSGSGGDAVRRGESSPGAKRTSHEGGEESGRTEIQERGDSARPRRGGGAGAGGGVSIPLAKMLNRNEICLDLSGKNLTSLEAALIARTLLVSLLSFSCHLSSYPGFTYPSVCLSICLSTWSVTICSSTLIHTVRTPDTR